MEWSQLGSASVLGYLSESRGFSVNDIMKEEVTLLVVQALREDLNQPKLSSNKIGLVSYQRDLDLRMVKSKGEDPRRQEGFPN